MDYPKYISKKELQKFILELHKGRIDKSLWSSLNSNFYQLIDMPIANIKWQLHDNDYTDANDPVTKKYSKLNTSFPPIILNGNTSIIDGWHRAFAAMLRGDKTIYAYIPIHEKSINEESSDLFPFLVESKAFRNESMVEKYTTQELSEILFTMMLALHVLGPIPEVKKYCIKTLQFPKFDHIFLNNTDMANTITTLRHGREILDQPSIDVPVNELKRYLREFVLGKLTESFARAFFFRLQTKLRIKNGQLLTFRREIVDCNPDSGAKYYLGSLIYQQLSRLDRKVDILALLQILMDNDIK